VDYDVIIVGTGFGATVAVSRLAGQGRRILMLERGTWWQTPEKLGKPPAAQPGDPPALPVWASQQDPKQPVQYWPRPDHAEGLIDLFASVRHFANRKGLYVYSRFDDADILSASGVGGGSLIYSNATLQPDQAVLDHIGLKLAQVDYDAALEWMTKFRGVLNKVVTKIPLPASRDPENLGAEDYLLLDRSRALRDAAAIVSQRRALDPPAPWRALDLAIAEYHESGAGNADVNGRHTFCERQGRCMLGCLPQARYTLNKTLYRHWVSDPKSGVQLRPLSEVRHVRRVDGGYEVTYRDWWQQDGDERTVATAMLVMGAGTLGTNEILLRSREGGGLSLSDQLGQQFSTNGNFGGFCLNTTGAVHSTRGPVNTCHVDFEIDGRKRVVEDCSIPSMVAAVVSAAVQILFDLESNGQRRSFVERMEDRVAHVLHLDSRLAHERFKAEMVHAFQDKRPPDLRPFLPHLPDTEDPRDMRTEAEAVENLFFFNCMGEDEPTGRFRLDDDDLDLTWDRKPGEQKVFADIEQLLVDFSAAMGGDYVPAPGWKGLFGDKKLTITHPLGGCRIGTGATDGVVDEHGRVFDTSRASDSAETYPGLLVADASVIPGSVVAHPTLTIVAQAIKTMEQAAQANPAAGQGGSP
jgi:cholesterol oxidase